MPSKEFYLKSFIFLMITSFIFTGCFQNVDPKKFTGGDDPGDIFPLSCPDQTTWNPATEECDPDIDDPPVAGDCLDMNEKACEMFHEINAIRIENGKSPLKAEQGCIDQSQFHAEDMATREYFSHTSPDPNGETFAQRASRFGVNTLYKGENIAAGRSTATGTADQWMNSSGHKRNILDGSYKSTGIGYFYLSGSPYGHYWVQCFSNLNP
jgi:hypothetical protein